MPSERHIEILNGWKEIANHLGKGVRTVQRYERELGLPVRRPAGKPSGSVIATRDELDGWVKASPIRESFPLPQTSQHISVQLKEFRRQISEMHRLREETAVLRHSVEAGFRLLTQNLRASLPETSKPDSAPAIDSEHHLPAHVLTFDPTKNKAN